LVAVRGDDGPARVRREITRISRTLPGCRAVSRSDGFSIRRRVTGVCRIPAWQAGVGSPDRSETRFVPPPAALPRSACQPPAVPHPHQAMPRVAATSASSGRVSSVLRIKTLREFCCDVYTALVSARPGRTSLVRMSIRDPASGRNPASDLARKHGRRCKYQRCTDNYFGNHDGFHGSPRSRRWITAASKSQRTPDANGLRQRAAVVFIAFGAIGAIRGPQPRCRPMSDNDRRRIANRQRSRLARGRKCYGIPDLLRYRRHADACGSALADSRGVRNAGAAVISAKCLALGSNRRQNASHVGCRC
jgi:hypothetical protein